MSPTYSADYLAGLVRELRMLSAEAEWVEFKHGNEEPREIGEYISALANGAALAGKPSAYMLWGIADGSHEVVGTSFAPARSKGKGNESLENWLSHALDPKISFQFHEVTVDGRSVVVLEIESASHQPVRFGGEEFVRVGSHKKRLKDHPDKERALWRSFERTSFEVGVAREHASDEDVVQLLAYSSYFDLLDIPTPDTRLGILAMLEKDAIIQRCRAGGWDITNLGAILFAKRLTDFGRLGRKAMRIIVYDGNQKIRTKKSQVIDQGYACGFESLASALTGLLPSNEVIEKALRKTVTMYPELAVRELVANALIHQDFSITGAGPMVEVFDDRIEISNPGAPLVDTDRFIDSQPKSRNETLASLMRRLGICEEAGSGIDKVVWQVELFQLPAPIFEAPGEFTRVVLFAHRPVSQMDQSDRVRACYLHACLKYVNRGYLTNSSLRERLGIKSTNAPLASKYIREAVNAGQILPFDEAAPPKLMRYMPWWAR